MDDQAIYKMMMRLRRPEGADWTTDTVVDKQQQNQGGKAMEPQLAPVGKPPSSAISAFAQPSPELDASTQISRELPQTPQREPTSLDLILQRHRASRAKRIGEGRPLSGGGSNGRLI